MKFDCHRKQCVEVVTAAATKALANNQEDLKQWEDVFSELLNGEESPNWQKTNHDHHAMDALDRIEELYTNNFDMDFVRWLYKERIKQRLKK